MIRKLTAAETEALLTDLSDSSNCVNGCQCIFCRTFDEGVMSPSPRQSPGSSKARHSP
jgi:hypothetical protein